MADDKPQVEDSGPLTVAKVASYHEEGRGKNPRRSFLEWVVENERAELQALSDRVLAAVIEGKMTGKVGLGLIGEKFISLSKKRIKSKIAPPLSEGRLKQKKRDGKSGEVPLIHTGQLINSLRYRIIGSLKPNG